MKTPNSTSITAKLTLVVITVAGLHVYASEGKMDFNYRDADATKVLEDYAKASGQKFIVDPNNKGKITTINSGPISQGEAFEQLSSALALNGLAISKQGDVMVVSHARMVERSLIEVGTELPSLKPERLYTWVINLKYANAEDVNKQMRILTSRDGELVPVTRSNQILVTDWTSNLHRIGQLIQKVDVEVVGQPSLAKQKGPKAVKSPAPEAIK